LVTAVVPGGRAIVYPTLVRRQGMRKPSRKMPPTPTTPMTWAGALILLSLGAGLVALVYCFPIILALIGAIILGTVALNLSESRRLARLAADRQGESICSFARSFDCRAVDTWVIRAVFEELQPYCRFGGNTLPLRPTDNLGGDLLIDSEDLDVLAEDIAYRAGRSLEDCVKNPLYGNVETVSDLVMFFVNQPALRHP
jgi:hypothetical protein